MSFNSDMAAGLKEMETDYLCGIDATWTAVGGAAITIRGVFNSQQKVVNFEDAGLQPDYVSVLVCDREQFSDALPAVGDSIEIDSVVYRIESVGKDETAVELSLKNP